MNKIEENTILSLIEVMQKNNEGLMEMNLLIRALVSFLKEERLKQEKNNATIQISPRLT